MTSGIYRPFKLGTRKSALARVQSEQVRLWLEQAGVPCEVVEVDSAGDLDPITPLYELKAGSPGFFTKQLEVELLSHRVDLAVHSLKDLPTEQPSGLKVSAVPAREVTGDCLIIAQNRVSGGDPLRIPRGASVGTSSLRREAQLLSQRPDLQILPIRGNVPTRVQAVRDGKVDAVMLAQAGLSRLNLSLDGVVKVDLPSDLFVPAPGQGALGVETRTDVPSALEGALRRINDEVACVETRVERRILRALEGGCSLPLGVRCHFDVVSKELKLKAFLGLQKDRILAPRDWISFHHFDICEREEETLVVKTVFHFKEVIHAK